MITGRGDEIRDAGIAETREEMRNSPMVYCCLSVLMRLAIFPLNMNRGLRIEATILERVLRLFGAALLASGFLFNPWVVAALLSPDGRIESGTFIVLIVVVELLVVTAGTALWYSARVVLLILAFARARPNTFATLAGCMVAVLITITVLLALECWYRLTDSSIPGTERVELASSPYYDADDVLGYVPVRSVDARVQLSIGGVPIHDVNYATDAYRRRITPLLDDSAREKFALFFGGSFVFGFGLDGHETLPAHFGNEAPTYRPYNYGFSGYGPQHMLAKLRETPLRDEVREETGIAVYVLIEDHVRRAIGSMRVATSWGGSHPHYVKEDGVFIRKGNMITGRPLTSLLYGFLSQSRFLARRNIDMPPWRHSGHYRFTVELIAAARDTFRDTFESDEFYVLVYPSTTNMNVFTKHLEELGIEVLDYSSLPNLIGQDHWFSRDGHPKGATNEAVAKAIAAHINTKRQQSVDQF